MTFDPEPGRRVCLLCAVVQRSSTVENSLAGHGYQQVGKMGTRKALVDLSNKQTSLVAPGKHPVKKSLGKPIAPAGVKQVDKTKAKVCYIDRNNIPSIRLLLLK